MSSNKEVIEVIYGNSAKYEVIKSSSTFSSSKFYLYKNGAPYRGSFSSLEAAVAAANKEK